MSLSENLKKGLSTVTPAAREEWESGKRYIDLIKQNGSVSLLGNLKDAINLNPDFGGTRRLLLTDGDGVDRYYDIRSAELYGSLYVKDTSGVSILQKQENNPRYNGYSIHSSSDSEKLKQWTRSGSERQSEMSSLLRIQGYAQVRLQYNPYVWRGNFYRIPPANHLVTNDIVVIVSDGVEVIFHESLFGSGPLRYYELNADQMKDRSYIDKILGETYEAYPARFYKH